MKPQQIARHRGGSGVNGDGVLHVAGIAAGEHNGHRNPALEGSADYLPVARFEPLKGQVEAAELVVQIRVGAGYVDDQVREKRVSASVRPARRRSRYSQSPVPVSRSISTSDGGFSAG